MVGGEEAENEEIKKRHQEKIEHVEARKRRLTGAQKQQRFRDVISKNNTTYYCVNVCMVCLLYRGASEHGGGGDNVGHIR